MLIFVSKKSFYFKPKDQVLIITTGSTLSNLSDLANNISTKFVSIQLISSSKQI